jgi:pSer/pThr/pTyr-binding forkhead associated (FHA) protein
VIVLADAIVFVRDMRVGTLEVTAALAVAAVLAAQPRIRAATEIGTVTPLEMEFDVFERHARRALTLTAPFDIGRDAGDGLALRDPEVSRRHARVSAHDGVAYLEDLRSSNGTFLNERRVRQSIEVQPGDVIDVGTTRIVLVAIRPL